MANGNSSSAQDGALLLARFREADQAYETAPETEKQNYFTRRHAALMLLLGMQPRTQHEICGLLRIAINELSRHVLLDGPVPSAVANALMNCLRAIEEIDVPHLHRERVAIELRVDELAQLKPPVDLESGIAKLDSLAGLLAYLANNSSVKDMQAVFLALLTNVETVRDGIAAAADRLMDDAPAR